MNILIYLIILFIGGFIGYKNLLNTNILKRVGSIQTFALMFLLFVMGIKIGSDKEIIFSLGSIGLNGLVLASSSIIFSILGVKIVSKFILREKEKCYHDN